MAQLRGPELQKLPPALEQHKKQKPRPLCCCLPTRDMISASLYPVQFFISKKKCHSETCPRKELSSTSWELGIRALAPRIQIIFNMALGAANFSLSAKISPHTVVEWSRSPSFRAVSDARRNIQSLLPQPLHEYFLSPEPEIGTPHSMVSKQGRIRCSSQVSTNPNGPFIEQICLQTNPYLQADVKRVLELLYERLIIVFESGKGSPTDQLADGVTILYVGNITDSHKTFAVGEIAN